MNTTRIFLCHDLDLNDSARMDVRILQQMRQKFQEAQFEVVLYPGPISDTAFLPFVHEELPTCQWFILFQSLTTSQSAPVYSAVEIARESYAQQHIRGLLRFLATPDQSPEVPSAWSDILPFGTTPDYLSALDQLLIVCMSPASLSESTSVQTPLPTPPVDLQHISSASESPSELIMLAYNTVVPQPPGNAPSPLPTAPAVFAYVPFNSPHPLPSGSAVTPMPPEYDRPGASLPSAIRRFEKASQPQVSTANIRPAWPFGKPRDSQERATTAHPRFRRILFTTLLVVFCVALALFINDVWLFHTLRPSGGQLINSTQAKSTSVVQATPGLALDPYTGHGTLIANDPLQRPDLVTGYSDNSGYCGYQGNALHVISTASYYDFGCGVNIQIANFVLEVQATVLKGSCAGIAFRLPNAYTWPYQLHICHYSSYIFGRYDVDSTGKWIPHILKQGTQPLIKSGLGATNTIALVANGSTFTWYVNYHAIASVTDATYKNAGGITLVAQSVTSPTEVMFTHLKIWQL